jgi:hypothetical protein
MTTRRITMRRFVGMLVLTVLAAATLAGTAVAKEGGVELSSTPAGWNSGDPWTPTLTLIDGSPEMLAQAKPGVSIRNTDTGRRLTFPARPTADPHRYTATVVFPDPGWWIVETYDGITNRNYTVGAGQYLITAPKSGTPIAGLPAKRAPEGGSFPIWPAATGGALLFLAAVGAALFLRRQRLRLSH